MAGFGEERPAEIEPDGVPRPAGFHPVIGRLEVTGKDGAELSECLSSGPSLRITATYHQMKLGETAAAGTESIELYWEGALPYPDMVERLIVALRADARPGEEVEISTDEHLAGAHVPAPDWE